MTEPSNLVQFYCVACDDFFLVNSRSFNLQRAKCTTCGEICNTTEYHAAEMARQNNAAAPADSNTGAAHTILLGIAILGFLIRVIKSLF